MKIQLIINPALNNNGRRVLEEALVNRLAHKLIGIERTSDPQEATQVVRRAVSEGANAVVVVGGDGTINVALKEIVGTNVALGIIPAGLANDLASLYNIPSEVGRACDVILAGFVHRVDVISVNGWHYVTAGGIGVGCEVAKLVNALRCRTMGKLTASILKSNAAFKTEAQRVIAGAQRAFIYTHEEYKQWVNQLTDRFFTLTYLQMVIAIIIAALGIINTLVISVAERQREFGIIRAIGGLRGQVRKMILLDAISISLIGIAAGVVAGVFSAYFMVRTAAIAIAGFTLQFHFPLTMVLVTFPVVLAVALAAAWLPAQRAMRLRVAEAISYE